MIFRIVIIFLILAAGYALFQIVSVHRYYASLYEPSSVFTVKPGNQSGLTIVEFLNYDCGHCKDTHLVLLDYAQRNPDVTLVVRPVPLANGDAENAAELALAAGLQDKFWDMDRALVEYKGKLDEKFYRESAAVYDIDYDRMVREAGEETVQDFAKENIAFVLGAKIATTPAFIIGKTLHQPDKALTTADLIRMVEAEKRR